MPRVTIFPDPTEAVPEQYRAVADGREAVGGSAGQALDALAAQLGGRLGTSVVVVYLKEPDEFFTAEQHRRLTELRAKWKAALDAGKPLPPDERAELDDLIFAELGGTARRTAALTGSPAP